MSRAGRLRAGVAIPQVFGARRVDADLIVEVIEEAENLGFEGVWTQEDVLTESGTLDALTTLAFAAARTTRVHLGVAVLLTPLYDPVQLAKAVATIDQLSSGRLILGLGLGSNRGDYPAHGLSAGGRAARFDAVVETVRALWAGENGGTAQFPLDGARMQPRPIHGQVPIWFGGHSPAALRRAASAGNGFIGGGASSLDEFAEHVRQIRELRGSAERSFQIAKRVYLACTDHVPDAEARLLDWLDNYYGDPTLSRRVAVVGDVAGCVEQLRAVYAAGADYLILNFVIDEVAEIRAAARDLLPMLRS